MYLTDAWKLNTKFLLEAKIFHCFAGLPLQLLSVPYYKWNVEDIGTLNSFRVLYAEILQEF